MLFGFGLGSGANNILDFSPCTPPPGFRVLTSIYITTLRMAKVKVQFYAIFHNGKVALLGIQKVNIEMFLHRVFIRIHMD